jgi:hypothetical protein
MNLRMPSRRAMMEESEMKMDRERCLGCEMRAKTMPMTMASSSTATIVCVTSNQVAAQHCCGPVLP